MNRSTKIMAVAAVAALSISGVMLAQANKMTPKKGYEILQPQMVVEHGTYAKPMGTIGTKVTEPWSATTHGASVDGKPNPAKPVTMVGEIIEPSCYLQIGKRGEKHRDCAQKCFRAGQPIGLLTENGDVYLLMDEEHDPRRDGQTDLRSAAIQHASHIMEVHGTLSSHAGMKAIYVQGFLKK